MAVNRKDVSISKIDKDTIGGPTYYIRKKGSSAKPKAVCFRKLKGETDVHCTHEAGYRTSHLGTGACRFHGGADKTPPIKTGKYAVQTKRKLQGKIDEYINKSRDDLLDLTEHLAATRAIFDEFMTEFPDPKDENYGTWFSRFNALVSTLSNLVDKISKIDSRNTLTAAQVLYLRATMIDIIVKYLPDPNDRMRVMKEIALRMGGDNIDIEMKPSEISLPMLGNTEDKQV